MVSDPSKMYNVFHSCDWNDIYTDIDQKFPFFFNIRRSEAGVQKRDKKVTKAAMAKANLHCIIEFEMKCLCVLSYLNHQ